ncbi:gibberellin 2-beta-dioxygenase-like [Neltuma alba]|uniref:gibberellin 2-beta-dioxygenase-like n=1 Tax=Neltuma alba TaxID=207710 RepID=UPI0010A54D33|nr:gibberellin 2-beta-dioxygenase-like [Prosopis alba]XP_028764371.1 gibberellin 2-beta-dioxygenase-like [Prosopis alba]
MVVLSHSSLSQFLLPNSCMPTNTSSFLNEIPEIDLSDPQAKTLIVKASQDLGFFKLVNHGVPFDLISNLETQALNFFALPQPHKDRLGPPDPFGYGNNKIGPNGDVGWIQYLLLNINPEVVSPKSLSILQENPETFRRAVEEYISAMKNMSCKVLELMAEGLGLEQRNAFSKLLKDESDCYLRLNYYPPCEELEGMKIEGKLIGFGEHTDPQIISVLRSNATSGLQICMKDGTWVSVPPDNTSYFVNIGDSLQVMTNERFRSVKHRVVPDTSKSRLSMIYFVGPALNEKIRPLPSLMSNQEESLYKEFTWYEYKNAGSKTRLSHDRLALFHKSSPSC